MSETKPRPGRGGPSTPEGTDADAPANLAIIVDSSNGESSVCTLYPIGVSSIDLMSRWISADEDAFVELEAAR